MNKLSNLDLLLVVGILLLVVGAVAAVDYAALAGFIAVLGWVLLLVFGHRTTRR